MYKRQAVIGGVIGAFSATGTAEQIAKTAGSVLAEAMFQTAPYAVIFTVVLGIAMGFAYYRSAVRTFKACETETDEDAQYAVYILSLIHIRYRKRNEKTPGY